jgi:predicted ATPase
MGSGGKAILKAVDRNGSQYEVRRIWRENSSAVYFNEELLPGVSIRETVLHKPIYFGQKDLSSTGEGFEKDLVEKLMGAKLDEVRRKIAEQKGKVAETVDRLLKINSVSDQIAEQTNIKLDTEHRLKLYKDHGIEGKLQKRLDFDNDLRHMKKGNEGLRDFIRKISQVMAEKEDELRNMVGYASKHNQALFDQYYAVFQEALADFDVIKGLIEKMGSSERKCVEKYAELMATQRKTNEEFDEIERKLADELKHSSAQNINPDDFLNLRKKLARADQLLGVLKKENSQKDSVHDLLTQQLRQLNDYWHEEFVLIKNELDKISSYNKVLSICSGFKEDGDSFLSFMKSVFKGSKIRSETYQRVVDQYQDFIAVFNDFDNAKNLFGASQQTFVEMFRENMKALLTYQTPNKFVIEYHGKALQNHSLGQRASALILFVLSQKENDVIIIDQPEDDLDNQTIYEDVIKLLQQMKSGVQFIFATHNPNIPVLGDAEEVHACQFYDGKSSIQSGSIDDPDMQRTIIKIMEGGDEAFNRRKEIYHIWNP